MGNIFDPQGQVTPKWIVWSGWNSNSSETLWLPLLPTSMRNIQSKMKSLSIGQHFHHYKYMGANFRHSRARNPEVNSLIWPKFELIREFMAVLATCKFDEDPIKTESTIDRTRSNMGFFGSQVQVTPKWKVWSGQNSHSSENLWLSWLPAGSYLQVWRTSDQNWIHYRYDKVKYGLFQHSRASNSDVNSLMWLEVELIRDFMAVWLPARLTKIGSKVKSLSSGQHCLHYKSMGKFFIAQGQVTPKKIVRSGPKSKLSEIL